MYHKATWSLFDVAPQVSGRGAPHTELMSSSRPGSKGPSTQRQGIYPKPYTIPGTEALPGPPQYVK